MKLAFLLYKFFPYGGMQRDFLRFAEETHKRGHQIRVYCIKWQGDVPDFIDLCLVPVKAWSNHRRNEKFTHWVQADMQRNPVDGVVGFNKMPGLDVYYAADSCYLDKALNERGALYRLGARFRHFSTYEKAVFSREANTEILLISETEKAKFTEHYQTGEARSHMLPPGIALDRRAPPNSTEIRQRVRQQWQLQDEDMLLLFIGSGFIKKGLDRAIQAVANLDDKRKQHCQLMVIGQDKEERYKTLAKRLGVEKNIQFMGGRDDIPELLLAADAMIHPALDEAAGIVLLEAVVAGLPVLVTDICGYAHHIARAKAGRVLSSPFKQQDLDKALNEAFDAGQRDRWRQAALAYANNEDLYSMHETGAKIIERCVAEKIASTL